MATHRKKRIPKLCYTKLRGIGWHVAIRDPETGLPRKIRFGNLDKRKAEKLYHEWLAEHLGVGPNGNPQAKPPKPRRRNQTAPDLVPGCILEISSRLRELEKTRTRKHGEPRTRGTIDPAVAADRKKHLSDFLDFMNDRHGQGALARMRVEDVAMEDVEEFNRAIVERGLSASQVSKRLQMVKSLIDRAGRPEHGQQRVAWNWDSRDVLHGKPTKERKLPTVAQLKKVLGACEVREQLMIWMAIGMGFGQSDLAEVRAGQIDGEAYDLRRGKTGIARYGDTPKLVWTLLQKYLDTNPCAHGERLFITRTGHPLTHGRGDSVQQWWYKLRKSVGETVESLSGFYVLRHLGATEFGSRPQCSIGDVKRWLGHSASSHVADVYMKPVAPENRPLIEWVRTALESGRVDLSDKEPKRQRAKGTG